MLSVSAHNSKFPIHWLFFVQKKKKTLFEDVISGWAVTFKNSFFSEICVFSSQLYDEIRMVLIKWILEVKKSKKLKKRRKTLIAVQKPMVGWLKSIFLGHITLESDSAGNFTTRKHFLNVIQQFYTAVYSQFYNKKPGERNLFSVFKHFRHLRCKMAISK